MRTITFQSIFGTPADPTGAKYNEITQTVDGRLWEYLHATEAISQYMIVSRPANTDVDTVSSSASNRDSTKYVYVTEASAGWTVGAYQDHWILVNSGTGVGQLGKVKDNTADTLELYYDYAFTTALAVADSDIEIVHVPDAEKIAITNRYTQVKGVAQVAFASGDDGWFLKRGVGGVLMGEAGTVDRGVCPGDDTEGEGAVVDDGNDLYDASLVGRCICPADTADKASLVDVNII